jgi:TolB-like protein
MFADIKLPTSSFRATVCVVLLLAVWAGGQNLLAVLDLENNGSVTQAEVTALCNRISEVIARDSVYMQFERSQLPELLKQLYIEESATACSDPQCLTVIGSLIGANFVVGGSIRKNGREITIELNLVDVANKKAINTVDSRTKAKADILLKTEIPALVKTLMNPGKRGPKKIASAEKNGFFANPLVYIGTGLAGAAAGGVYYYFNYYKQPEANGNSNISLDDAPVRTR